MRGRSRCAHNSCDAEPHASSSRTPKRGAKTRALTNPVSSFTKAQTCTASYPVGGLVAFATASGEERRTCCHGGHHSGRPSIQHSPSSPTHTATSPTGGRSRSTPDRRDESHHPTPTSG